LGYIDKDKTKGARNPLLVDVYKKCEKGLAKIKKHPFAEYFINPMTTDAPSLSQIEKNLKSYQYTTPYQFGLDIRRVLSYYFSQYAQNPDIYQKTLKLLEFSEDVLKEVESTQEDKSEIQELHKKVEKLTREMKDFKSNPIPPTTTTTTRKPEKNVSIYDKPMTIQEKNALGNNIRSLTQEQMKGIVNILSDSISIDPNKRFFEFDIDTLSNRKLRELERYVKQCMKANAQGLQGDKTGGKTVSNNTTEQSENERVAQLKVKHNYLII
jgi:hypothetical protein